LRRGLRQPAQEPEETPARLLQRKLLRRYRRIRRRRCDGMRTRVLSDREGAVRLRLPVRSREGYGLHPGDAAHIRFAQSGKGCAGEDFPREFGGDYWDEICKIVA